MDIKSVACQSHYEERGGRVLWDVREMSSSGSDI